MAFDNKKQLLIIVGAVAAGVVAVALTANYIKANNQEQAAKLAQEADAKVQKMSEQLAQRSDAQMQALAQELQRTKEEQAQALQRQTALMQQALQEQVQARAQKQEAVRKPQPSLALKVPDGKRAVTVTIDSLAAVGGLINAGDFVDVIAQLSVPAQETDKKTVTAMIFQDLQVLAVNTNIAQPGSYDDQQAQSSLKITFAVDPQEAGLLAFADKNGTLELALRSPNERQRPKVKADTWKTLADYVLRNQGLNIQNPDEENTNKPEESKPTIQIFRHGQEL